MNILPRHIRQAEDVSLHCPNCEALQMRVEQLVRLLNSRVVSVTHLAHEYGLEVQENPQEVIDLEDGKREESHEQRTSG